jgi:DNA-binding CsgD family transcriptional regulator
MLAEQHPAPMPSPEAGIQQRAVEKVLERVAPSRRTVAALRVSGYTETEVAEELGVPLNTVRSRWRRAKKELWAAVAAFLAAIWLWLVSRGRSKRPLAGAGGAPPHGRGMLACAALPLVVVAHTRVLPPAHPVEVAGASTVAPQNDWLMFSPVLTTNAEGRSALSSSPPETSSVTSKELSSKAISSSVGPSRMPISAARREAARAHLVAVHRELREQHDPERAREILALYEMAFPEDPFPRKHAELAAALKAP